MKATRSTTTTSGPHMGSLGPALQRYLAPHLVGQRNASLATVRAYRDTFRLLLRFLQRRYGLRPEQLGIADLTAQRVAAFLDDLERSRGNGARSRNARLAAVRSFLRYAAADDPGVLPVVQRVLAIPAKRHDRRSVGHLTPEQMQAVLDAPSGDAGASARRDQVLLLLLYNTGARASEVTAMRVGDVTLGADASVRICGKGRKQRTVPLWRQTSRVLRAWVARPGVTPESPLVPNGRGGTMTRFGVADRLRRAVARAAARVPSLAAVTVTPHVIRHTTAMHLLQSGVDLSVIALWLGHESVQTTHQYLAADLEVKRRALACLKRPRVSHARVGPVPILSFLGSL